MAAVNSIDKRGEKNGWLRVLGIDPASAGRPGRNCRNDDALPLAAYGALKVAVKRQKNVRARCFKMLRASVRLIEVFAGCDGGGECVHAR